MSADEIRRLAQQIYCDGLSVRRVGFEYLSSRINQCFNALLDYAEMVERFEERHAHPCGISDYDYNYILRGDAGKEARSDIAAAN